jgi:hypothetical protein
VISALAFGPVYPNHPTLAVRTGNFVFVPGTDYPPLVKKA